MRILLGLVLIAALFHPSVAHAAPSEIDRKRARALMEEGDVFAQKKDYGQALEKYVAGDAIMNVPTTGLDVALMLEKLGRLVEAETRAQAVADSARIAGEPG